MEGIAAAAEKEAAALREPEPEPVKDELVSQMIQDPDANKPQIVTEVKDALNNINIGSLVNKIASNPDEITKAFGDNMPKLTPELMEEARKLVQGGQADHIIKEMQKRGMDPRAMRDQLMASKKAMKGTGPKIAEPTKQVVEITVTRQVRQRAIPISGIDKVAETILGIDEPVQLSCSRMAIGPLDNKNIKVWYDQNQIGKNRLASKVVGFPIAGQLVIVDEDADLKLADVNAVLKMLD